MIFPIRCYTCSDVIADKYLKYLAEVRKLKTQEDGSVNSKVVYLSDKNINTLSPEAIVMNQLGITNVCCRRHFLTHCDVY